MSLESKLFFIGIDLMGADCAPKMYLKALIDSFGQKENVHLSLFATPETFSSTSLPPNFTPVLCSEIITMSDDPLFAARRKKNSSMHQGLYSLKEQKIDAFISLGNTGALVASSVLILKTIPPISRPALLALLPTHKKPLAVLDLGAHIDCKPENFFEFALLGRAYQKTMGINEPKIGLLNIGTEKGKGTHSIKKVYSFLEKRKEEINFAGNIEPKEVFNGDLDVILTDGFTGNVLLKTSEGIASLVLDELGQSEAVSQEFFQDLKKRLHYGQYPGAILLGLKSLVVKCHGYSSSQALVNGVLGVIENLSHNFIEKLKKQL